MCTYPIYANFFLDVDLARKKRCFGLPRSPQNRPFFGGGRGKKKLCYNKKIETKSFHSLFFQNSKKINIFQKYHLLKNRLNNL
jgi:hypothetical protein